MIPRTRPARAAAAVGVTVAAGAAAMLAVTTTASADEPGHCVQNVNVREDPDAESRIVALCEAGTRVKLGEERDGFVRIDELGGWAAEDYVKADESSSSDRGSSSGSSDDHSGDHSDGSDDHGSGDGEHHGGSGGGEDSSDEATSGSDAQLEGLLG
jgi:hypothetical protein